MSGREQHWAITDHVCRVCFGRILRHRDDTPDGVKLFRCACCGIESKGWLDPICSCGMKFNSGRLIGVKCQPNPNRGPNDPAEIVAMEA